MRHSESKSFNRHFDYRRVIGKLIYHETSTRPDINDVIWICRYLAVTKDKQDATDTDTAKSRTGFIITYAGCPII
jgi:hypothetical protein